MPVTVSAVLPVLLIVMVEDMVELIVTLPNVRLPLISMMRVGDATLEEGYPFQSGEVNPVAVL